MKIKSIRLYKYALALKEPFMMHGIEITQREGLVVRITAVGEFDGFGEILPLTGRSTENLNEAYEQVEFVKANLLGEHIPDHAGRLDGVFAHWLEGTNLLPSVQCGVEMAILNLLAGAQDKPVYRLIDPSGHDHIRIHGFLQGSRYDVVRQAQKLKEEGFTHMKLKVGGSVDESIAKVKAVNEVLDGKVLLHLDANQAWTLDEAIRFGKTIECSAVSHIEEPLKNTYDIPDFYRETTIPVGLDESLLRYPFDELKSLEGVDVLVLKPMLLGGLEKAHQMMDKAKSLGLETTVSSSYESGLGILALANLAGCTARDRCAGLDTLKIFHQDLLKKTLTIDHGKIDISQRLIREDDLNFHLLKEIQ